MQTQPRFTVVTFVLVALVGMAVLRKLLAPYVVAPLNRRLAGSDAAFLQAGARQHVAWYPVSELAFQEARRLDRPILLCIGAPWSLAGRRMDASVFSSATVQKLLARNFICIRADAVDRPDWMAAYLPLTRASINMDPSFQIWILDPKARLFAAVAADASQPSYGESQFTNELVADLNKLEDAGAAEFAGQLPAEGIGPTHDADLNRLLEAPHTLVPTLLTYRDGLLDLMSQDPAKGFPVGGSQRLWPVAWRFLLASSGPAAAAPSLAALLRSPTRDLLDGGFFIGSRDAAWLKPIYDKVAVPNAEMCLLLAQFAAVGGADAPYARFAQASFDSLTGRSLSSDGYVLPCRIGDENTESRRSRHSSFSPRKVRSLLDGVERDWAQANLHLRPYSNPPMTPYLTDLSLVDDPMYERVVRKLRGSLPWPAYDLEVTLATAGDSVARLLEAARTLEDQSRIQRAHVLASRIDLFRRGSDVVHEINQTRPAQPTFGDYLAFADVKLEDFLCSTRVDTLEDGAVVLARALKLFVAPSQTCYRMALPDTAHQVAPESNTPQICDDCGESTNAAVIRLTWAYGRLLEHSDKAADREMAAMFRDRSATTITRFADAAVGMGPYTGGYALASALSQDDTIVLCSGPDPLKMADDFQPKCPFRLVVPVAGPVYPSLLAKPGYYLARRGRLVGPLSEATVLKELPPTLFIGG